MTPRRMAYLFGALLALVPGFLGAQDLASFEKRVTVKTLANGLTLLVCERPEAPVISFVTWVNVGSDREVPGITGLAHMFEHMAFKGTRQIGTKDFPAEEAALEKLEQAYAAYDRERRRETGRDEQKIAALEKAWKGAMAEADKFVVENELGDIVEREGGVGLNAFTSTDATVYLYSFPANRLELWACLESERFENPVLRSFYKERDVVQEERRIAESNPNRRLFEQFAAAAFTAHPYGQPVLGWFSDLRSFSATDARAFFSRYYVPSNMVVAIVGDVKAAEALPLVEKYFGRLPAGPRPEPLRTIEPEQKAEREVVLRETAQPIYIEGYHKPNALDPDDAVFVVISDITSNGRTSRLYRSLVRDQKIAASSGGFSGYPGDKYPNLFAFHAVPTPGHTAEEMRDAIHSEIGKLAAEDVTDDELRMAKVRAKANLVRQLGDNMGLARQLAEAQALFGDWRDLFRSIERIEKVTQADIRRVAAKTFVASNRTIAYIESTQPAVAPAAKRGEP